MEKYAILSLSRIFFVNRYINASNIIKIPQYTFNASCELDTVTGSERNR